MDDISLELKHNFDKLNDILKDTKEKLEALSPAAESLEKIKDKTEDAEKKAKKLAKEIEKAKKEFTDWAKASPKEFFKSFAAGVATFATLYKAMGKFANVTNETQAAMNRVNLIMGDNAQKAKDFANKLQEAVGIRAADFLRLQSTIYQSAKTMGIGGDNALIMSQNITQLSYDMAGLAGDLKNVDDYLSALQNGLTGNAKQLRNMGFALTEADLKQEALLEGLSVNVRNLNAASKAMLRYNAIIRQSESYQNGYINNFMTMGTAQAIFSAQVKELSNAIGKLLYPIVMKVMPYLIAFVQLLTSAVNAIAKMLGIELPEIKSEGTVNNLKGIEEQAKKTGKAIEKSFTLGIDELNVLEDATASAGSGFDGMDITNQIQPLQYDFLKGFEGSEAQKFMEGIKEKVEELQPLFDGLATAIGGAFKTIANFADEKLLPWLKDVGDWMKDHPETLKLLGKGLGYVAIGLLAFKLLGGLAKLLGIPTLIKGLAKAYSWLKLTGLNGTILLKGLGKTILWIVAIWFLVQGAIDAVAAAIRLVTGDTDDWGKDFREMIGGIALALGGIIAIIFGFSNPISWLALSVGALIYLIANKWDELKATVQDVWIEIQYIAEDTLISIAETAADLFSWSGTNWKNLWAIMEFSLNMFCDNIRGNLFKNIGTILDELFVWIGREINRNPSLSNIWDTIFGEGSADKLGKGGLFNKHSGGGKNIDTGERTYRSKADELIAKLKKDLNKNKADRAKFDLETAKSANAKRNENLDAYLSQKQALQAEIDVILGKNSKDYDTSDNLEYILQKILGSDVDKVLNKGNENSNKTNEKLDKNNDEMKKLQEEYDKLMGELSKDNDFQYSEEMANLEKQLTMDEDTNKSIENLYNDYAKETANTQNLLTGFESKVLALLEGIKTACENIKINVYNGLAAEGYAGGGSPTSARLFYANENGTPELVGRVGNRTVVANNDQIFQGIYQAVSAGMANMSQQPIEVTSVAVLDGETVYRNQQRVASRKGYSMGGGAFAHV